MEFLKFLICICSIHLVTSQNDDSIGQVLSCDFLNVTSATDESFNGEYGLSPLVANGAPDKDVYEKQDGSKVIFWKNGEWVIGPNTSVTTGEANYGGHLSSSRSSINTWHGKNALQGSTVVVTNNSRSCSDDFDAEEEDYYLDDVTSTMRGPNNCQGVLIITYSSVNDPSGSRRKRTFQPNSYRNTKKIFRRRSIQSIQVTGTCSWNLYSQRRFRGTSRAFVSGSQSHLSFIPYSIATR